MKINNVIILLLLISPFISIAQELDCRIQINHSKLQGTTYEKLFQTMNQELYKFVNNTNWTKNVFAKEERIECNIMITIDEQVSSDEFKGKIQVSSFRPVYGTSYNSPILNLQDNYFQFKYVEFEPLEFNPNMHSSNLVSVIAYYVYIIIGFDYDSFGPNAGTPYFQIAEKIVQNAQSAVEPGWKAYENLRNRYWLVENLLNDQYSGVREFMYKYHRQGMDRLGDKPADARQSIEQAIDDLKNVHRRKPESYIMTLITSAKGDEIVNIFSEGSPDQKARVVNVMKELDPANSSKYDKIMRESSSF
jgi:hypothetical protein